ncbi:endo-1,4-beta-xylanase [Flindersiella endophytica]
MMTKRARLSLAALLIAAPIVAAALQVPAQPARAAAPFDVLPADPLAAFTNLKGNPAPQTQVVDISGNPNFSKALQITTTASPQSQGLDGEYEFTAGVLSSQPVSQGDAMLATFWARSTTPIAGGTFGLAQFVYQQSSGSFHTSGRAALKFTSEWQKFEYPFHMDESDAAGATHFNLWLGYGPQSFQIAGLSVKDYGQPDPTGFPKVTYQGRESGAAWRTQAQARIEQYRKGNLTVNVVDAAGNPVPNAAVRVDLQKHAFKFGTAADGAHVVSGASYNPKYRQVVTDDFNQVSLANDFLWHHWENLTERNNVALPALKWAQEQGLFVREGHLVWPSWGYLPADVYTLRNDPTALRQRVDNHIVDETSNLRGEIPTWNVLNEPYSEHNLQDILGQNEMARWFQLARQGDPKARLVLNDYDILEGNGWNVRHQNYTYNAIKLVKDSGAPIDGIGIQGHFRGTQPTAPENLLPILDRFASFGLPIEITEFDLDTADEQLQADYTRDFMTMAFSYPKVTGISNWGLWESNIWCPDCALYRADWSLKPNGQVLKDLVHNQWWTNASGSTNAAGSYATKGFLGDYLVTVTANGATEKVHVSMPSNVGKAITIRADGTSSDDANLLKNADAELGSAGWYGFSPSTAKATTDQQHLGNVSIRSSGRTAEWQGPAEGVQVVNGQTYVSNGWVKLAGGSDTTAQAKLKLTFTDGTSQTIALASATATASGWTQLRGGIVPVSWSGKTLDHAEWWLSTTSGTADLFVDDVAFRNAA